MVFILIIVLCIVVVLVSWSYQKSISSNSKGNSNQNTPTTISAVNSEHSAKKDTNSYNNDHLVTPNLNQGNTVSDSYGLSNSVYDTEHNENIHITIQPNPCYSVVKQNSISCKDQYDYVESSKFTKNIPPGHTDDYVEMQDPSLINQGNNTVFQSSDVQMTNNPSYVIIK